MIIINSFKKINSLNEVQHYYCAYIFLFSLLQQPWHMSAAMLNAFHNVWLRQTAENQELSITVYNHPLPRTNEGEVRT